MNVKLARGGPTSTSSTGLLDLIWAVAGPALTSLFEQAIQPVSGL